LRNGIFIAYALQRSDSRLRDVRNRPKKISDRKYTASFESITPFENG